MANVVSKLKNPDASPFSKSSHLVNVIFGSDADKKHDYVLLILLANVPEREIQYPEFSMFGELLLWAPH
jgi:hypothetical protein